jgi:hypothetical protein
MPWAHDGVVRCEECGFDGDAMSAEVLVGALRSLASSYGAPLTRFLGDEGDGLEVLRRRPSPAVWSALEYAAHARDALEFYVERIARVLVEERPTLTAVGWSAQAEVRGWNAEQPEGVASSFSEVAERLASLLESLEPSQWERVGLSSEGDGAERTVRVLAERAVHEGRHHLLDVGRSLRAARGH